MHRLRFYNIDKNNNFIFFDKLKNKEFKLLYLVGSDNLEIKKMMSLLFIKDLMVIKMHQ